MRLGISRIACLSVQPDIVEHHVTIAATSNRDARVAAVAKAKVESVYVVQLHNAWNASRINVLETYEPLCPTRDHRGITVRVQVNTDVAGRILYCHIHPVINSIDAVNRCTEITHA